uniref:C2 domain-containing protein n=1 Tax=Panagrolaimus superbus TaxID=310955 RepID=A0A914YFU9_9BILA
MGVKYLCFILLFIVGSGNAEFWLTATVDSLNFNTNCIESSRCEISEASFKLSHQLPSLKELKSTHFPVVILHEKLTLISHWEFGNSNEIETSLEIVKSLGSKPAMTWTCDETNEIILVEERIESKTDFAVIKVKGRCFNATITLQKYLSHNCPWCIEPSSVALTSESSSFHLLLASKMEDPFVFWLIVVAAVLVFTVFALLCFLFIHLCTKSKTIYSVSSTPTMINSKNHLFGGSPTDSNPSYVNTKTFLKENSTNLPYFVRPEYLYSEPKYDKVVEFQTPKNGRRKVDPETPDSLIRTPSPSIISNEV